MSIDKQLNQDSSLHDTKQFIIKCSECGTRYKVSEKSIKSSGTKVRCNYCDNVWVAKKPEPTVVVEEQNIESPKQKHKSQEIESRTQMQKEDESRNEEATIPKKTSKTQKQKINNDTKNIINNRSNTPKWLKALTIFPIFLIIVSLFFSVKGNVPGVLEPIYSFFEIYDTSLIEFSKVTCERNKNQELVINAEIVNNAARTKNIPGFKFYIYDNEGSLLHTFYEPPLTTKILKDSKHELYKVLNNISNSASTLVVDLGNPIEMMLK